MLSGNLWELLQLFMIIGIHVAIASCEVLKEWERL
jgi:hypothetical protein